MDTWRLKIKVQSLSHTYITTQMRNTLMSTRELFWQLKRPYWIRIGIELVSFHLQHRRHTACFTHWNLTGESNYAPAYMKVYTIEIELFLLQL